MRIERIDYTYEFGYDDPVGISAEVKLLINREEAERLNYLIQSQGSMEVCELMSCSCAACVDIRSRRGRGKTRTTKDGDSYYYQIKSREEREEVMAEPNPILDADKKLSLQEVQAEKQKAEEAAARRRHNYAMSNVADQVTAAETRAKQLQDEADRLRNAATEITAFVKEFNNLEKVDEFNKLKAAILNKI
jgi:hypothetical protein